MAKRDDLRKLATERLADAKVLLAGKRYDAAAYLCGYVLEMALKACICKRLRVVEYPDTELQGKPFKSHDFDELLLLAGLKAEVSAKKHKNLANWSLVEGWKPEMRYQPAGQVAAKDAEDKIRVLSEEILPWLKKRW